MQNVALRIASELHLFDPMTWVKVDTTANTNGNHEDARNKQLPGLSHGTRVEVSVDDLVTNIKSLERLYGSQDCTFNGFGQVSAELVFRTMRVLAAIGIWTEIGYQRYVTNPITWLFSSRGNDGGIRFLWVQYSFLGAEPERHMADTQIKDTMLQLRQRSASSPPYAPTISNAPPHLKPHPSIMLTARPCLTGSQPIRPAQRYSKATCKVAAKGAILFGKTTIPFKTISFPAPNHL